MGFEKPKDISQYYVFRTVVSLLHSRGRRNNVDAVLSEAAGCAWLGRPSALGCPVHRASFFDSILAATVVPPPHP